MSHDGSAAEASDTTSVSLLDRVRQNDSDAWKRFVRLYGPLVYRWCRRSGLQPSDASDVVQNVLRSVCAAIGRFRYDRPGDTLRGWLWTITCNKIRDHANQRADRPAALGGDDAARQFAQIAEPPAPDLHEEQELDAGVIHRALQLLKCEFETRTWDAFWRATVEREKASVIADDMGTTVHAVYKAKSRVLRRVRQELTGLVDQISDVT